MIEINNISKVFRTSEVETVSEKLTAILRLALSLP